MTIRRILAAALAAALLGATHAHRMTVYRAPAGARAAGTPHANLPFSAILPNGRIVSPVGSSVLVGAGAMGVALTPDDRYAIVANADSRTDGAHAAADPRVIDGYSLAVVDTRSMRLASVFTAADEKFFGGVAALRDPDDPSRTILLVTGGGSNVVHVLDLDSGGTLTEEPANIAIPLSTDPGTAGENHAFPWGITLSADRHVAYVTNDLADTVTAIDVAHRTALQSAAVGFFPTGVAVAGSRVYVADEGLEGYTVLPGPAAAPAFAAPSGDPSRTSTLYSVATDASGDVDPAPASEGFARMDPIPDGLRNVGGAHPAAIAISRDGRYAYVALTGVDRVTVVRLGAEPRVIGGLTLRLFSGSPYGTQPDAIVRSPDGKRLYVALAGIDAVAVLDARDPTHLHRLGLIPTGALPTALALSRDGRYLYVANLGGNGRWSTLQRVDLRKLRTLEPVTLSALRYARTPEYAKNNTLVPPLGKLQRSSAIAHVVFILDENAVLDAQRAPYLASLAQTYASAGNFYANAPTSGALHQLALAGTVTPFALETTLDPAGRAPFGDASDDPEDYPRAGYIFNALARAGMSYRDYGDLLNLSGYAPSADAPAAGLGGSYAFDVPALAALAGHVDLSYPGWNPAVSDRQRAQEFVRDYGAYAASAGGAPAFTSIWLSSGDPVDDDQALGTIVDYLIHAPEWSSTAIFIVGRFGAVVVSPYAKHGYVDHNHLSSASVLKTEEELLGLPALSLDDLLATDMSDCFGPSVAARTQSGGSPGVEETRETR